MELTEFQKKALEIDKHISLTANAGSGKTFVLAKRFVEIAIRQKIHLNKIAAITFTEKAAGELYFKIAREINNRLISENDLNKQKELLRIRNQLVSANISTIHSFCNSLLKEFAPEAGVDSNFAVIDASASRELIDEIITDYIETNLTNKSDEFPAKNELQKLVRIFGSVGSLISVLRKMFNKRKTLIRLNENIYQYPPEEIARKFHLTAAQKLRRFLRIDLYSFFSKLKEINDAVLALDENNFYAKKFLEYSNNIDWSKGDYLQNILALNNLIQIIITQNNTLRKVNYLNKIKGNNFFASIEYLQNKIFLFKEIHFDDQINQTEKTLAEIGKLLMSLFNRLLIIYENKKNELSYLDLEDLLLYTLKILKNNDVRSALSNKFKHILVDEYQDTNEVQYEIILPLIDELKKGKLFIVGDDKQSIYMFREAELEVFKRTTDLIEERNRGTGVVELPHSFRLSPYIALFTNKVFSQIFKEPDVIFNEVKYSELITAREPKDEGTIEFLFSESKDVLAEAELVTKKIIQLKNQKKIPLEQIAILCARRDWFDLLAKTLNKFKVPYSIVGSKGFFQNQVIADVYNYLAFLLDRNNDAALLGVLRSPFFYLTDEELFKISFSQGNCFYEKLKNYSEQNRQVKKIVDIIEENIKEASELPLNQLLRKVVLESGYYSVIASRKDYPNQLANLKKLLNISVTFQNESFNSYYDFVEYLKNSIETNTDESEGEFVGNKGSVQIMTIHQSKGLEFEAVFIFKAHEKMKKDLIKTGEVFIDKEFGLITKVPLNNDFYSKYKMAPIAAVAGYLQNRKQFAEFKRLFYVGVTRAKNYLFISGLKSNNFNSQSFLGLLKDALNFKFDDEFVSVSGKLKYLIINDGEIKENWKEISFNIQIIKEISDVPEFTNKDKLPQPKIEKIVAVEKINDVPEKEIFSATRISVYSQCPLKYKLIYELGMGKLLSTLGKTTFEFNNNEDKEDYLPANIIGTIVHAALEKNITENKLTEFVKNELLNFSLEIENRNEEIKQIVNILLNFKKSEIAAELSAYRNYYNEFNIYLKENNYFLFGILDKLIITDDSYIVVDYKTDFIDENNSNNKFNNYINQLLFYSYLVKKYFPQNKKIILWLVFVRKPEASIRKEIDDKELLEFSISLNNVINGIQSKKYFPDANHCNNCQFYLNNNCIY